MGERDSEDQAWETREQSEVKGPFHTKHIHMAWKDNVEGRCAINNFC